MVAISPLLPTRRYTPDEVWAAEFEPLRRDDRRRADERRTEAFLEVVLDLCGEPVRQMSCADMLTLDALGNPFIAGSNDGVAPIDCYGFIWQLHAANNHSSSLANLWRRHRFLKRISAWSVANMATDISAYVDRMLMVPARTHSDTPESPVLRPEPRTHFIAPLIVSVAAEIGHIDPVSGNLLAHIPLPRLIQYGKSSAATKGNEEPDDSTTARAQCAQRTNELNWIFTHGSE